MPSIVECQIYDLHVRMIVMINGNERAVSDIRNAAGRGDVARYVSAGAASGYRRIRGPSAVACRTSELWFEVLCRVEIGEALPDSRKRTEIVTPPKWSSAELSPWLWQGLYKYGTL